MVTRRTPLAGANMDLALGVGFGLPIGVLSGFTGVGGGEYRAPVLLALTGRVRWSIAANLLIGVLVSVFNFTFRHGWTLRVDLLLLGSALIATSVPGAYVGAFISKRTSAKRIKILLAGILVATGLRLILVETHASGSLALDAAALLLALVLGFGLGIISGLLGLAAGEYRIPALILVFGVPTVLAGTLSSLAAIPQQVAGFVEHRRLGHTGRVTYRLGAAMGVASVIGVFLGVSLLGRTSDMLVAQVLGAAMMAAAGRIAWDVWHPSEDEVREAVAQDDVSG